MRHVVLCITAGVGRTDFRELFPPEMLGASLLIENMQYNGHVAGHRAAMESILNGRYVPESESGQQPLAAAALFGLAGKGRAYLLGADRHFLKWGKGMPEHAHFGIAIRKQQAARPRPSVESVNPDHVKDAQSLQEKLVLQMADEYRADLSLSEDLLIAEAACLLLQHETPTLTVVHFMGADVAHGQATQAKQNMGHIGRGIQNIWKTINNNPKLKGKTVLIALPDFGRNGQPNGIIDENGEKGSDHSIGDENTKKISCLITADIATEKGKNISGESIDILPTIHQLMKPAKSVPSDLKGKNLLAWKGRKL